MQALIEAYKGVYEDELLADSPQERLATYLQWGGIIGFTETIWAIAQGER